MNGQMLNYRRYKESLSHTPQPVLPGQLPDVKMDLAGLSRYAKQKGVSLYDLTEQEKRNFIPELKE